MFSIKLVWDDCGHSSEEGYWGPTAKGAAFPVYLPQKGRLVTHEVDAAAEGVDLDELDDWVSKQADRIIAQRYGESAIPLHMLRPAHRQVQCPCCSDDRGRIEIFSHSEPPGSAPIKFE